MPVGNIQQQDPVRQEVDRGEAHTKDSIVLPPSFKGLFAPPTRILLGRLLDGSLRVVEPFDVVLSSDSGQSIAEAHEVGEVGVGDTLSEALRDLQATLGELYVALESDRGRLGPDLAKTWAVMQRKVNKRA